MKQRRASRIYASCGDFFPGMPKIFPRTGLIVENEDGIRFGVWIMPDNKFHGMLETFLKNLIPDTLEPLMTHAEISLTRALELGAQCRGSHIDKALIHTWLAWQDPPGQPLGRALTKKILDPYHEHAKYFVTWFKNIYRL